MRPTVTGNAPRSRELPEEKAHPILVGGYLRMNLRVASLKIRTRVERRPSVSGARNVDNVRVMLFDQSIEMDIDKILTWRCSPMSKQSGLDMLCLEWLS
jgi:hypothetical protein